MAVIRYEHFWETTQLPDGTTLYRTNVHRIRDDLQHLDPETSIATRARNRQTPPLPDSPERFYRQERFGPKDARADDA